MSLAKGTRLGQYEVLELIGKGGMGEVYRGYDSQLKRDVALKVLPEEFASDSERLARFRREATMLASLNHPNIAAIYRLEQSGDTVAPMYALVMEYVQSETLADRVLREGAVPLDESLDIAKQICEALEHAHEKNIIHRDLKPANVKLTPEGKVKVLDFGLAKAFAPYSADDVLDSQAPTLPPGASPTIPGAILGTAAYMSPEQARGKTVDKRTDIFALGCVFYELLTGKKTFTGENITDTLGAVVHKEPDWSSLPETTPPAIRAILRRCLQKDATKRYRDAADIHIAIEDALSAPGIAAPAPRRWLLMSALACALVAAITGIAAWNMKPGHISQPMPVTRFTVNLSSTETLSWSAQFAPAMALSPDGSQLAFVADGAGGQQLYLRSMDSLDSRPIPGTQNAYAPFFSPDGQWIGFAKGNALKKVSVNGGPPVTLANTSGNMLGASWGPNDTIVFVPNISSGIFQIPAAGGTPQALTALDSKRGENSHRWPEFLPGGKAIIFSVWTGVTDVGGAQLVAQRLDTGERKVLVPGATFAHYAPSGQLVYYRGGTLMAVPFDVNKLEVKGSPVPVVEGVLTGTSGGGVAQFAFSNTGSLVYIPGGAEGMQNSLVWVDRKGEVQPLGAPPHSYAQPRLSPDGRKLAVTIQESTSDIWVYDLSRSTLTRFTFEGNNLSPIWTPDSKRIAFISTKSGLLNLFWKLADGTGGEEQITKAQHLFRVSSISPDGKWAFYVDTDPVKGRDIWVVSLEGDHKASIFLQTPYDESVPRISPDGHWLAHTSDESGRDEIYVRPFPGPGGQWQISTDGGQAPTWARNGKELFYINGGKMMAVDITTQPSFVAGTPRMLFQGPYERRGGGSGANFDVSPDGQRFLMVRSLQQQSSFGQINVVLNWFEELKQKVPAGK